MRLLTFDLEDWYHILDHPETERPEQWISFPSRIERNTERILNWLRERKVRSTWFVLGWVAERYPELVRRIAAEHDIAAHGYAHQLVYRSDRESFREDTRRCLECIRQAIGRDVSVYRAGGFLLRKPRPGFSKSLLMRELKSMHRSSWLPAIMADFRERNGASRLSFRETVGRSGSFR